MTELSPGSLAAGTKSSVRSAASSVDLDFFEKSGSAETFTTLMSHYEKLLRKRNQFRLLFAQHGNEMSKYEHKHRFVAESVSAIVATFARQSKADMERTPIRSFDSLKARLLSDGDALSTQSQMTLDVISKAGTLQYEIAEHESHFMATLEDFMRQIPGGQALLDRPHSLPDMADEIESQHSDTVPDTAQQYFDKLSAIRMATEKIGRLDYDHMQVRIQRELMYDQERAPSTSDEEFEIAYLKERNELASQRDLDDQEAERLRSECEKQQLDLERLRYRQPIDETLHSPGPQKVSQSPSHAGHTTPSTFADPLSQFAINAIRIRATDDGEVEEIKSSGPDSSANEAFVDDWLLSLKDSQQRGIVAGDGLPDESGLPSASSGWPQVKAQLWKEGTRKPDTQQGYSIHDMRAADDLSARLRDRRLRRVRSFPALVDVCPPDVNTWA